MSRSTTTCSHRNACRHRFERSVAKSARMEFLSARPKGRLNCWVALSVIASAEVFFEPNVQADKKISAAHLTNLEFGFSGTSVAPGDRDDGPGVASHNRFERQFHCEI